MDLSYAYLRNQGTVGELKEMQGSVGQVVLAYAESEACIPEYYHCLNEEEAVQMIRRWEVTGEFVTSQMSWDTGMKAMTVKHPTRVGILRFEKEYMRRPVPRQPTPLPWE